MPIKLSPEEKIIFERYFRKFISKKYFKILISYAEYQTFYNPIELCTKGNPIKHIIFINFVSKNSEITVSKDDTILLSPVDGYWIGINGIFLK